MAKSEGGGLEENGEGQGSGEGAEVKGDGDGDERGGIERETETMRERAQRGWMRGTPRLIGLI